MAQDPTGQTIRNMIALQRLANGLTQEARRDVLIPLFNEIVAEIARLDPGSESARILRESRLEEIMAGVSTLSDAQFNVLRERLQERLEAVGVQQGRFAGEQLIRSIGAEAVAAAGITIETDAASPDFLRTIIEEDPFGGADDKKILAEWTKTQDRATVRRVRQQIQLGMANGETLGDIVRRVRGTQRGGRFVGGVLGATTRETEAIARTAINHVSNASRQRTFDSNADILSGVESVAVLDSRTCLLPGSLVVTERGEVAIEDIEGGDKVRAGSGEYRAVTGVLQLEVNEVATLRTTDGKVIRCAPDHRVLTEDGRWVEVRNLRPGDKLADG